MENLSKTIAEVKSALDQATHLIAENESLRAENKRLQEQELHRSANTNPKRDLKIAQRAFEQGEASVFFQLRDNEYETEYSIEESCYSDGFEVSFCKDVDIEIPVNDMIDGLYTRDMQETIDEMLINEVLEGVDAALEADVIPTDSNLA
tara:strand:- start:73 stop:519 length:447 start_codon:yes stop_codon:yes gene_type:complete